MKEEKFDVFFGDDCGELESTSTSSGSDQTELSPPSNDTEGESGESSPPPVNSTQKKRKRRRKRMLTGVSRQRRAANERERRRIQGVNRAFVELKNTLPVSHMDISKIDILRVATQWIDHLSEILHQDDRARTEEGEYTRIPTRIYDDHDLYGLLDSGNCLTSEDDELLDDFLQIDECLESSITSGLTDRFMTADTWHTWQQPFGSSSMCVHTEEPYLQTLLHDNAITTNYLSSPLVDLADHL